MTCSKNWRWPKSQAGRVASLVQVKEPTEARRSTRKRSASSCAKINYACSAAARALSATFQSAGGDPGKLWQMYLLLTEIEAAFKSLKGDVGESVRFTTSWRNGLKPIIFVGLSGPVPARHPAEQTPPSLPRGSLPARCWTRWPASRCSMSISPTTEGAAAFRRQHQPEEDQAYCWLS